MFKPNLKLQVQHFIQLPFPWSNQQKAYMTLMSPRSYMPYFTVEPLTPALSPSLKHWKISIFLPTLVNVHLQ